MKYAKKGPGRAIGTGRQGYREDYEKEVIVRHLKTGDKTDLDIAAMTGWSEREIRDIRAEYFPRVGLALDYLRARSLEMAKRVVEEANVEEALDLLSRPNIGVLEPIPKASAKMQVGFFTNIQTGSLGAVQPPSPVTVIETVPIRTSGALPVPALEPACLENPPSPPLVTVPMVNSAPRPTLVTVPSTVPPARPRPLALSKKPATGRSSASSKKGWARTTKPTARKGAEKGQVPVPVRTSGKRARTR